MRSFFAIASCVAVVCGVSQAQAQAPATTSAPAASPYAQKTQDGIRSLVSGDYDGAIAMFREAAAIDPSNALAFLLTGEALRVKHSPQEALTTFRTAERVATQSHDDRSLGRALQAIAETLEQLGPSSQSDAREAWTAYATFADGHRDAAEPATARLRVQAIDAITELERVSSEVRTRIAERERENAHGSHGH